MRELFRQLAQRLSLTKPMKVYLAGGLGVYLYTGARPSTDVDAEFDGRMLLPRDLVVEVTLEDGQREILYFDTNYNPMFALLHENYQVDSIPVDVGESSLQVRVLAPVDLAVSKIGRFQDHDREDIAELVRCGLVTADDMEKRAEDALSGYVGALGTVQRNIKDAVALARKVESERDRESAEPGGRRTAEAMDAGDDED
ncbi:MAG TPA: DUF6036 family nucleotidyltransferase [Steroidobacteraceae bacterium]